MSGLRVLGSVRATFPDRSALNAVKTVEKFRQQHSRQHLAKCYGQNPAHFSISNPTDFRKIAASTIPEAARRRTVDAWSERSTEPEIEWAAHAFHDAIHVKK